LNDAENTKVLMKEIGLYKNQLTPIIPLLFGVMYFKMIDNSKYKLSKLDFIEIY